MPQTDRLDFEICPACGDGTGVPICAVNSSGDFVQMHFTCENCENRWSVIKVPDSAPFRGASAQARLNARMDSVIRLRPKLDRRGTPRY